MGFAFSAVKSPSRYGAGFLVKAGPHVIGSVYWGMFERGYDGPKWKIEARLPGLFIESGLAFETQADAIAALQERASAWLSQAQGDTP